MLQDLSIENFDEWIKFVFAHEVSPNDKVCDWYFAKDVEFTVSDEMVFLHNMTRLCREFGRIAPTFPLLQIDQGIWFLLGPRSDIGIYLTKSHIARADRIECISAMFYVYSDFAAGLPTDLGMPTCFNMWWDLICDSFWNGVGNRLYLAPNQSELQRLEEMLKAGANADELLSKFRPVPRQAVGLADLNSDEREIQNAIFNCLLQILELPDTRCQRDALHGLGHLRHPDVRSTVQRYIDERSDRLDESDLGWLERCRDGKVM